MTTLAVVTLADGDTDLFPFWLEHYRSLGVDRFVVCIDQNSLDTTTVRIPESPEIYFHEYDIDDATGEDRDSEERFALWELRGTADPDWILYTDLDEHQEYKGGLHAALAAADAAGEDVVMGVFADRVAADGSFPALPTDECLECSGSGEIDHFEQCEACGGTGKVSLSEAIYDTYPLRTNITRDLIGTRWTKIMAAKPGVVLRPGRHGTIERPYAAKRAGALAAGHLVHHFKWRAGIIERIKRKMQDLPHPEYDWYRKRYGPFVEMVEANGGRIPSEYLCATTAPTDCPPK